MSTIEEQKKDVLTTKEVVTNYLSDEKTIDYLNKWADYLDKRFRSNRFTIQQVVKKTPIPNEAAAKDLLGLLIIKGLAHQEIVDNKSYGGKSIKQEVRYKITLKLIIKLQLLKQHLETVDLQRQAVLEEIERLEAQIGSSDNK